MKQLITISLLLFTQLSSATSISPKPLNELVEKSEHVLEVTIIDVSMLDNDGNIITNLDARTGPGLSNTIRLHATVNENGILKTNSASLPKVIIIPLMSKWHYSLGQVYKEKGSKIIVLLKGNDYQPVYPMLFRQPLESRQHILKLLGGSLNRPKQPIR